MIAVVALGSHVTWASSADVSWMLSYAGRSTNALVWDERTKGVVEESLPPGLHRKLLAGLGGPPDPVLVTGSTLSASGCVVHSCPDKAFLWIDTSNGTAFGAAASLWGCDEATGAGLPCELWLGSRLFSAFQDIPITGRQALLQWMNEQDIRVKVIHFIDAANKTKELDPAEFHLAERFHPLSTGPSFDCRIAHSQIEKAICADPVLAKLDVEMGELYAQMHASYDTVGAREQLRDLQRTWLARRGSVCPDAPAQALCLAAEYRRQYDVLGHWVPTQAVHLPPQSRQ